jgi:trans-aconitate 2-methyltransferase
MGYQCLDIKILDVEEGSAGMTDIWDAGQYLRFGGERSRPFFDLTAQVGAVDPGYVADLGCGPGNLTAVLARRWPGATVVGVDNSAEMIAAATAGAAPELANLTFELGDVRDWRPDRPVDVLVCNAVLQWVPDHQPLLLDWADSLAGGGWLAFQLPGNFDQPSHAIIRELAESPDWRGLLADASLNRQAEDPAGYLELLARPGYQVDAWETSYLHVLPGPDPVLEWTKGTTLRPVLAALDPERATAFVAAYAERLRRVYQPRPFGTIFPFRRVFTVVHRLAA